MGKKLLKLKLFKSFAKATALLISAQAHVTPLDPKERWLPQTHGGSLGQCFFAGMGVREGAPIRWLALSPEWSLPAKRLCHPAGCQP